MSNDDTRPVIDCNQNLGSVAEAFRKAQESGHAEIILQMPRPLTQVNIDIRDPRQPKTTVIDRLKLRGTPIELIHSYLIAGDVGTAHTALKTCIIEAAYERLKDAIGQYTTVKLETPNALEADEKNDRFDKRIQFAPDEEVFSSVQLSPEYDEIRDVSDNTIGFAAVHKIADADGEEAKIGDSAQATIVGFIDRFTSFVEQRIVDACVETVRRVAPENTKGHFTIGIIPRLCRATIDQKRHDALSFTARIAAYAYATFPKS